MENAIAAAQQEKIKTKKINERNSIRVAWHAILNCMAMQRKNAVRMERRIGEGKGELSRTGKMF